MRQFANRSVEIENYFQRTKAAICLSIKSGKLKNFDDVNALMAKNIRTEESQKLMDFRLTTIEQNVSKL